MERTKTRKFIAEQIRSQYINTKPPKNSFDALARLQNLDRHVKIIPKFWCIVFGIIECIIFLLSVLSAMIILLTGNLFGIIPELITFEVMIMMFIISGIFGIFMLLNYPFYKKWYRDRHDYYANEINLLSEKILGEVEFMLNYDSENEPTSAEMVIMANRKTEEEKTAVNAVNYVYEDDEPEASPESLNDVPVN